MKVGGPGRGRRTKTQQLNNALVLALAAEYQGFLRDLHDEAVQAIVRHAVSDLPMRDLIGAGLRRSRELDAQTPREERVSRGFARIGMDDLWDRIKSSLPKRGRHWVVEYRRLLNARNAIAHADEARLAQIRQEGCKIDLAQIRAWRNALNGLARVTNLAVQEYLEEQTGHTPPW